MGHVPVTTADDERLADYVRLREVSLRRSLESRHGLFIAEGEKVIRRAIRAGYRPRSFLLSHRWLEPLADVLAEVPDVPCYVGTDDVVEAVTGFHVHRGALASLHRVEPVAASEVLAEADRVVVLEHLVDHTNVGAIFRSAAALGMDAVVLSPRCADPLYRRAVKVSMGAVFALPWARMTTWAAGVQELRAAGYTVLALTPDVDAVDLAELEPTGKVALVVGSEGPGLSTRWRQEADRRVRIPMHGPVESLNVAAASAVACYVLAGG